MADFKFIADSRNQQAAIREFESDLDRLIDDFLLEVVASLPDQYVPVHDVEDIRQIGNVLAVKDGEIEVGLEESVDAAFENFSWHLTRALRTLRERAR